ncbi:MAG: bifunctional phosphoribosylaminoimidazolecarboxamide formyltransferase/IMP cyclohydrolase [Alphaproteobacteria bacterium]
MFVPIKQALISVSDKTGLEALAQALVEANVALVSTGGTAQALKAMGFRVRDVSELTHLPEMMDGRLKTLHPGVHGGLLARRDSPDHLAAMAKHGIEAIDLLVVNLYPFEATLAKTDDSKRLVENIDIGGPAMIRAAAKNHDFVAVVTDPADYPEIIVAMRQSGGTHLELRRRLAAKAFSRTAAYDALIGAWMSGGEWPDYVLDAARHTTLRYGENPQQKAALYRRLEGRGGLARAQQLQGKELSYNNLQDADTAFHLVQEFDTPTVAIVKHANPCGVAQGQDITAAFIAALAGDPVSAFGGILAANRAVDAKLAEAMGSLFLEVIIAPEVTPEASEKLVTKKNLRVLIAAYEQSRSPYADCHILPISGGYLLQTKDSAPIRKKDWKTVTKRAMTAAQQRDAEFAMAVVRSVKSNAIVLVKNGATIGIGAGQMSRVDAVRIAIEKARAHGHDPRGSVLASDAFFPFADNVALAAEAGIAALVQPGGSVRDAEVIAAADTENMVMIFTGTRHFRH